MNTVPREVAPSAGTAPNLTRRALIAPAPVGQPNADLLADLLTDPYVARSTVGRPRVLIVTPQPFYEDRGTPIAVRYVASALGALNVDVHLLAFPVGRDIGMKNVTIHRCANALGIKQVPIGFSLRKLALDGGLWRSFSRLLASRRFDVVHAVEEAAYMASVLCPPLGQRFIYDMASAIPTELVRNSAVKSVLLRAPLEAMQRRVMNNASHIICSAGLAGYVRIQAADAPVIEWQYPALSSAASAHEIESLRCKLQIHPGQRVLLYTGSFAGYQGLDLLLAAFARVSKQHPDLVLVCVGASDEEQARWSTPGPDRSFDGNVRIVPRQPRAQMPLYMELADVLLLPRVGCQNVPLKLYDYMAAGKPIVATRQPGSNRLLNEQRAFLCDATAESLADAVARACSHPAEAAWIASQALRYAEQHFGWRGFVEFVRHIYLRVIPAGEAQDQLQRAQISALAPGQLV
jgi:glycosyltransferase involved in cell wall biosynthesis